MKQLSGSITLGIRSYSPNMCVGGRTLRHEALFQNASEHSSSASASTFKPIPSNHVSMDIQSTLHKMH
jgi:hypothetical protein